MLRRARLKDLMKIYRWRNLDAIIENSTSGREVGFVEHVRWFLRSDVYPYIIDEDKGLVWVRKQPGCNEGDVSLYLLPEYRGRGIGRTALDVFKGKAEFDLGLKSLIAFVRAGNNASVRVFKSVGFKQLGDIEYLENVSDAVGVFHLMRLEL